MVERDRVLAAVNFLVEQTNATMLLKEITKVIESWDTHPMVYGGKLEVLNALVDIGLENREAFEKIVALIQDKRKLLPATKRIDYQKDLMRERRARFAKAIELHEYTRGGRLTASEKEVYTKDLAERWRKAKDEFILKRGKLSWKQRNEATREFWQQIDTQLDSNLRAARKKPIPKLRA